MTTTTDRLGALRRYLEGRPGDRFALYALALELHKAGEDDEALVVFDRLLGLHPGSGAGHFQRGLVYVDRGDHDGARRVWREALEVLPRFDDPEAVRSIGEIRGALADLEP